MKKRILKMTALMLSAALVFCSGCGTRKDESSARSSESGDSNFAPDDEFDQVVINRKDEFSARSGGSGLLFVGGYAVSGDLNFALDDEFDQVVINRKVYRDEDERVTSETLAFSLKKDMDGGCAALSGTFMFGNEEDFWDAPEVADSDPDSFTMSVIEPSVRMMTPQEVAELRLSGYTDDPKLDESKKGEITLLQGAASSEEQDGRYQFYEMCAVGNVDGMTFYMDINGTASDYTDGMALLSGTAQKIWDSLEIKSGEPAKESLFKDNKVYYLNACGKALGGCEIDISSLDEADIDIIGNDFSGSYSISGCAVMNGITICPDVCIKLYKDAELFENAKSSFMEEKVEDPSESNMSGQLDWSCVGYGTEESPGLIAWAKKDGVYLLCSLGTGADNADATKETFENCKNWLLSLDLK